MRKKIWMFIGGLWLAAVIIIGINFGAGSQPRGNYTIHNPYCKNGTELYVSEDRQKDTVLYKIDQNRKVNALLCTQSLGKNIKIKGIDYDDALYVLTEIQDTENSTSVTKYRIYQMNNRLKPTKVSGDFSFDLEGNLSGFSVKDNSCYLTLLSPDGVQADGYALETAGFEEYDLKIKEDKKTEILHSQKTKEASQGHFFVEAAWEQGEFRTRTDEGMEDGEWLAMLEIKVAFEGKKISLGQRVYLFREAIILCGILLIVGATVLGVLSKLLKNRNRIVYVGILIELVMLSIILACIMLIQTKKSSLEIEEKKNYVSFVLEDVSKRLGSLDNYAFSDSAFYRTESYQNVMEAIKVAAENMVLEKGLLDLCIINLDNNRIVASLCGYNGYQVSDLYTSTAEGVMKLIKDSNRKSFAKKEIMGEQYLLLGAAQKGNPSSKYAMFGITSLRNKSANPFGNGQEFFWLWIIFGVGSLLSFLILWIQSKDLKTLRIAMQEVAVGKYDLELKKKAVFGSDVELMWNSLNEINKTVKNIYYTKYQMLEAYYRFAPKQIEKLLGKESITEVKSGDLVRLKSVIAMISIKQMEEPLKTRANDMTSLLNLEDMNRLLALISHYQEKEQGMLVSGDGTLSAMKIIFPKETEQKKNIAIEFGRKLEEIKSKNSLATTTLLHKVDFLYGVAGVKEQSMPFLISKEMEELEKYTGLLHEMGIRLVASESIDRSGWEERYIGYFELENTGRSIKLYEILEVCPEKERRKKLFHDKSFQQAIQLFYQKDFYLARSTFTGIVKDYPEDKIAKWYLFTCEKYLNETNAENISCKLNQ